MYASQWFITIFTVNFPFSVLVRIWDMFLLEGMKVVYRIGLAILSIKELELLKMSFEQILTKMKSIYNEVETENLIKVSLEMKVSNKMLEVSGFFSAL